MDLMIASPAGAFQNAFQGGMAGGAQAAQMGQQNALRNLYQTQGAGIANGDPNAINALAGLDPMAALGVRQTTQQMAATQEQLQMARDAAKRAVQDHADKMTAAEAAAESEKMGHVMEGAMMAPDEGSYNAWLTQNGVDPGHYPFAQRDLAAAAVIGMKEVLDAKASQAKAIAGPKPADDYQRYVQEEAAAGRKPMTRLEFMQAGRAPVTGLQVTTGPDGTTTVTQGPGVGTPTDTIAVDPRNVDTAVSAIDEILNDPGLNGVVGPIQGGGGNNVDDLGLAARIYYRGKGLALIQKINQLQSTTWLAARQMLKGGGAITDYESKKAEAAMARLSRAQDEDGFRAALQDLKDAIEAGRAKLANPSTAAGETAAQAQGTVNQMQSDIDMLLQKYGAP